MKDEKKKEIIEKVSALNHDEQTTVLGVIHGMKIANTLNAANKKKIKEKNHG